MCQNYWKYEISALNIPPSDNFQIGILRQSKFVQEVEHQFVIQVVGDIICKILFRLVQLIIHVLQYFFIYSQNVVQHPPPCTKPLIVNMDKLTHRKNIQFL